MREPSTVALPAVGTTGTACSTARPNSAQRMRLTAERLHAPRSHRVHEGCSAPAATVQRACLCLAARVHAVRLLGHTHSPNTALTGSPCGHVRLRVAVSGSQGINHPHWKSPAKAAQRRRCA
jgi:hypothetical protein